MAGPEHLFQRLLTNLSPMLASNGFKRLRSNFICESAECWGTLNFQKDQYFTADERRFTINVDIAAKRVVAFVEEVTGSPIASYRGQWQSRIGWLMPSGRDVWWTLAESSYSQSESDVRQALVEFVIPKIKGHMTEEALLSADKGFELLEFQTLRCKSILLAGRGKLEDLEKVLDRMREMSGPSSVVEQHIALVKRRFSITE